MSPLTLLACGASFDLLPHDGGPFRPLMVGMAMGALLLAVPVGFVHARTKPAHPRTPRVGRRGGGRIVLPPVNDLRTPAAQVM
jgi:hypothetical protein